MNKEQYLNLISADVAAKIPGDFPKFDPTTLYIVGKIILILVEECLIDENRAHEPSWLDKIRLRWLVRTKLSWKEYRQYGAEISEALLQWGEENDTITLRRMIARLRQSD